MFLLQLQQLQMNPTETLPVFAVARSEGVELLRELYFREMVTPYTETLEGNHTVEKHFRKGGPLEWYIPLDDPAQMFVNIGTKEERIEALIVELKKKVEIEWTAMLINTAPVNSRDELEKVVRMENANG
jgi:hypothetical protein